jgi:hypothetical protein
MKQFVTVLAIIWNTALHAQTQPSIVIDDEKVMINDGKGSVWLIDDNGISKNGVLLLRADEMYGVDAADDLQDEIEDLKEEIAVGDLHDGDYSGMLEELAELEEELNHLENYTMRKDSIRDSTTISVGEWKITIKEDSDGGDDVDFSMGKDVDLIEEEDRDIDNFITEWFLLSAGYNTFVNADYKFEVPAPYEPLGDLHFWGSLDLNLDIFKSRVNFGQGFVNFNYGLGLEWHHYRFDQDFSIVPDIDSVLLVTESLQYDKNKFNTTHVTLPLSLGFETKPWNTDESFRIAFGYSPGLRIKTKTKHKIDGNSDVVKDQFNVNEFRQEINATIGYGDFNVYASYDITPLFQEGTGPELYPVSIGIIITRGF